jgi:hypothetical protein
MLAPGHPPASLGVLLWSRALLGRGIKNGQKIKRIFIFMCAELSDIPTGPCLGFYVIPGANDDDEEEEKHEFVHAPLLKSCHDDDDDDNKEEKRL